MTKLIITVLRRVPDSFPVVINTYETWINDENFLEEITKITRKYGSLGGALSILYTSVVTYTLIEEGPYAQSLPDKK